MAAIHENICMPIPDEIPRVALIAAAGFYHSPANAYERPKRDIYSQDTVASYHNELSDYLWNKLCALLVIDGSHDQWESLKLYPALQKTHGDIDWSKRGINDEEILGFMCLTFKSGSSRIGQYQREGDRPQVPDDFDRKRDQSVEGVDTLSHFIKQPLEKHLGGMFTVDMIAVHPSYWRRGFGSALLAWATNLADEDNIPVGLASVPMGVKNAQNAGFKEREVVKIEGYSQHPDSFDVWIGVREPRTLDTYAEDVTGSGR